MRQGANEAAVAAFDEALALLPDYGEAIASRAEALDALGKSGAVAEYGRARALWSAVRVGAPDRRYLFRQPGHSDFGVESYARALERIRTGALPHLGVGNALLVQGRAEEALGCYDRALKIKANDPDITALRGEALSAMGQHAPAIDAFDFALALNPKDADSWSGRAIACLALGRVEEADSAWRRQLALLRPDQAAARACVALRLADHEAAVVELDRAIARDPRDAYWPLYRLASLRQLGRPSATVVAPIANGWPAPLYAFHAGHMPAEQLLASAADACQRFEAAFHLGRWRDVVDQAPPYTIEYAAARHELARQDK